MKDTIVIGITFSTTRFEFYPRWVIGNDRQIRIVLLAAHLSNAALLDECDASLGGTLLADLEESGKNNHRRMADADGEHLVQLSPGSQLAEIAQTQQAMINSAHHQAVDRVADELMISGISPDNVIEALEWKLPANHSPLLAVQWHPERVEQADAGTLSIPIRNWLLHQAQAFHENK